MTRFLVFEDVLCSDLVVLLKDLTSQSLIIVSRILLASDVKLMDGDELFSPTDLMMSSILSYCSTSCIASVIRASVLVRGVNLTGSIVLFFIVYTFF